MPQLQVQQQPRGRTTAAGPGFACQARTLTEQLPIEITGTVDVDPAQPGRIIWNG